jgi:hypothetical protein
VFLVSSSPALQSVYIKRLLVSGVLFTSNLSPFLKSFLVAATNATARNTAAGATGVWVTANLEKENMKSGNIDSDHGPWQSKPTQHCL